MPPHLALFASAFSATQPDTRLCPLAVVHSGSISMDDVIRIARIMRPKSLAKKFEGTVLEILGTAHSTGCQVDGQDPHDIIEAIHDGEGPEIPDE
jgi:large subunit ribosomal protein L12e